MISLLLFAVQLVTATPAPDEEFCVDCCSLYCAVLPTLSVSSGNEKFIADGELASMWTVDHDGQEWIEFEFSDEESRFTPKLGIDQLFILTGAGESKNAQYGRPKELEMLIDGRVVARIELADSYEPQRAALPRVPLHNGLRARFRVTAIFPGTGNQLAVREIRLEGYGHH